MTITLRTFRGGAHKTAFLFPLFRCQARAALRTSGSIFAQRINKPEKNARLLTSMHEIISKFRTSANHTIRFYFEKTCFEPWESQGSFPGGPKVGFSREWPIRFFQGGQQWLNLILLTPKLREKYFKRLMAKYQISKSSVALAPLHTPFPTPMPRMNCQMSNGL